MKVEQICNECGKTFLRSLYHPQVKTCPGCRHFSKDCALCKHSHKKEWYLVCEFTGIPTGASCGKFEEE